MTGKEDLWDRVAKKEDAEVLHLSQAPMHIDGVEHLPVHSDVDRTAQEPL